MDSPKYFKQLKPHEQSKLFQQALFPIKNLTRINSDPFRLLSSTKPTKLQPICISGALRLPKIMSTTELASPKVLKISKKFVLSPRNFNSSVSSSKASRCKLSLMPATPSSKSSKFSRSQSSKILKHSTGPLFGESLEVSFGNQT